MDVTKSTLTNKKWILPSLLILGMLLIAIGSWSGGKSKANPATAAATNASTSEDTYVTDLENRLEGVLGQINGAGDVSVMVTLSGGSQDVLATNDKTSENSTSSGTTTSKDSTVVTANNAPLVLQELKPEIQGVVVVASGANNPNIVVQISQAVVALTGITVNKVVVLPKTK